MANGVGSEKVYYPEGFNESNCVVVAFGLNRNNTDAMNYGYGTSFQDYLRGSMYRNVKLDTTGIEISMANSYEFPSEEGASGTFFYKIVLMKTE